MTRAWEAMPIILCLSVLFPIASMAQSGEDQGMRSSIGFHAGYGASMGNWSYSRESNLPAC